LAGLETALLQTKLQENLNNSLDFWGKIIGKTQDYLVAQYINSYADFPLKKFYFCTTSDYTLRAVPPTTSEFDKKAAELLTQFEGDPSFFMYSEGLEEEVPNEDEDAEAPKQDSKFREIHRLAYTVRTIDHDCFLAPRGAYVLDASKSVIRNSQFQGLSYAAAAEKRSFVHLRAPENPQGIAMLKKGGVSFSSDFMDSIANDKPQEMWVVAYNSSSTLSHVRNLYWEGFHFYAVLNGNEHGAAYFGLGLPNIDIAFML
jgi:radial spoke head protein 9